MTDTIDHRHSGVYAIVNTANGRRYVGSAINIARRWKRHRTDLNAGTHHSRALQRAWLKHGAQQFDLIVLEEVDAEALIEREQAHIDQGAHYNCAPLAGSSRGAKQSEETRQKHRDRIARQGHPMAGRGHTEAARAAMSEQRKGKKHWKMTDEIRAKMSASAKGRAISPEQRAKISATLKARHAKGALNG